MEVQTLEASHRTTSSSSLFWKETNLLRSCRTGFPVRNWQEESLDTTLWWSRYPLLPMFTLGHNFTPANIHAGGLRYHGAGVIIITTFERSFDGSRRHTATGNIQGDVCLHVPKVSSLPPNRVTPLLLPYKRPTKCKETGEEKVILFNLSGHGLIDMSAYDQYLSGNLTNYTLTDKDIGKTWSEVETMQP